jgi:hypothetical protein
MWHLWSDAKLLLQAGALATSNVRHDRTVWRSRSAGTNTMPRPCRLPKARRGRAHKDWLPLTGRCRRRGQDLNRAGELGICSACIFDGEGHGNCRCYADPFQPSIVHAYIVDCQQ